MLKVGLTLFFVLAALGCANQTTFHTAPLGAQVYINGALCGQSPCVYHTRYGFPDRIHLELKKPGYQTADFYLDTEPPQISYLLLGFGSYLFHTFLEEYRFELRPLPEITTPQAPSTPPPATAPVRPEPSLPKPRQGDVPESPSTPDEKSPTSPSLWI